MIETSGVIEKEQGNGFYLVTLEQPEVTSSGESLDADMSKTYEILELKKEDMTSLESYIKEYYQQILKRLKEMEADLNIEEKKRLPF